MAKWLAVVIAVAAVGSQAAAGSPDPRYLVVPGRSVGPVALGMTAGQVEAALGRPARIDRGPHAVWYTWRDRPPRSLAVEIAQGVVILISVARDPRYRTTEGVGPGDTADRVERVFGRPSGTLHLLGYDMLEYQSRGVGFVVIAGARDGRQVTGVLVAARL